MKTHTRLFGLCLLIGFAPATFTCFAEETEEEQEAIAKRFVGLVEAYAKQADSDTAVFGKEYWLKLGITTESLTKALQNEADLDHDPFICAQDIPPGFILQKYVFSDEVAKIYIALKPWDEAEKPKTDLIHILAKENGEWKLDDIHYPPWEEGGQMRSLKEYYR